MEYGILKVNTTQNSSNGMSKEIKVLNVMFFNSTLVLINRFASEGNYHKRLPAHFDCDDGPDKAANFIVVDYTESTRNHLILRGCLVLLHSLSGDSLAMTCYQ